MNTSRQLLLVLILAVASTPVFAIGTWPTPEYPVFLQFILALFGG